MSKSAPTSAGQTRDPHPLAPLSPDDIKTAVGILRAADELTRSCRIQSIWVDEPEKKTVQNYKPGSKVERKVALVVLDRETGAANEILTSLTDEKVVSRKPITIGQPAISLEEFEEAEKACRASAKYQAALAKRGITKLDDVIIDLYGAGAYGDEVPGKRLARGLSWVRFGADDNPYAHPIDNVHAIIDLNSMEVLDVEDYGVVEVPREAGNYHAGSREFRSDLKPLDIVQPEGPSFVLNGYELKWQKWSMRIGFTQREGLVLHQVGYFDKGRVRPVIYRAALAEQVTPYGDPRKSQFRKNAFDEGEYNLGSLANSLKLGCDCLGEIRYLDAAWCDTLGNPVILKNAVCIHEEDNGVLWKHWDFRKDRTEVRRSRRLVVSMLCTIANYDYGFYWYFYQDGRIQFEIRITGVLSTAAIGPNNRPTHGQLLNKDGLYGPIHQHIFNVRLDMAVDGNKNSVYEVDTVADADGPDNPFRNGYRTHPKLLKSELEARRHTNSYSDRYWKIVNHDVLNKMGEPVGYKLVPESNLLPFAQDGTSIRKRARFTDYHLWCTAYRPNELFPSGDYPNQHPGEGGLPEWTKRDESIENADVVLWYTLQNLHAARLEDWPIIGLARIGFYMQPIGFFDENPAIDVPPSPAHCHRS